MVLPAGLSPTLVAPSAAPASPIGPVLCKLLQAAK